MRYSTFLTQCKYTLEFLSSSGQNEEKEDTKLHHVDLMIKLSYPSREKNVKLYLLRIIYLNK